MPKWYKDVLPQESDPDLPAEIGLSLKSRRPHSRKPDAGCVVEFIKKDRLCCGAVWPHVASGRMQLIIDRDAPQSWVRRSKLLDVFAIRVPVSGRRQRQSARLDMETLWTLATESGTAAGWTLDYLTELAFDDQRSGDSRAVMLRALYAGECFARCGDRGVPHNATSVERSGAMILGPDCIGSRSQ